MLEKLPVVGERLSPVCQHVKSTYFYAGQKPVVCSYEPIQRIGFVDFLILSVGMLLNQYNFPVVWHFEKRYPSKIRKNHL